MTAVPQTGPQMARRRGPARAWTQRLPRVQRVEDAKPPSTLVFVYSWALTLLAFTMLTLVVNVTLISQLQHFASQHSLYQQLRSTIADQSVPIGQRDVNGHLVERGTPIALLTIPELGIKEVIVQGAASDQTKLGVGHRSDTPFPGQPGSVVLLGRASAYGGVFGNLSKLRAGDQFTVTTGQGKSTYQVIGASEREKISLPALTGAQGRITLFTSSGPSFFPTGVLRLDADLITKPYAPAPRVISQGAYGPSEKPLAGDPNRINALAWLLELLVLVAVGAVWAWKRWSQPAMWIVFVPVLAATGLAVADHVADLLPNLM
jgi:sortase A